jgi:hypothetical protein
VKYALSTFREVGIKGMNAKVKKERAIQYSVLILNFSVGKIVEKYKIVIGINIPSRDALDQNKALVSVLDMSVMKLVKIHSEMESTRIQKDLLVLAFGLLCKTKKAKNREIAKDVREIMLIKFSAVKLNIL